MRLQLTKRGDYAIRAMIALSQAANDERLSARRIADAMAIPVRFVPQVMGDLVHAGLAEGVLGRSGGYRLARPAAQVSLLEIIEAVEGDSRRRACVLRGGPCGVDGYCDVHDVFFEAQEALLGSLEGASLGASAERARRRVWSGTGPGRRLRHDRGQPQRDIDDGGAADEHPADDRGAVEA